MERVKMQNSTPTDPITVTIREACRLLGIGNTSIYGLIGDGRLKTITIGRRRLVVYQSLVKLAQAGDAPRAA
jgi:excisionase family DNA binding protein